MRQLWSRRDAHWSARVGRNPCAASSKRCESPERAADCSDRIASSQCPRSVGPVRQHTVQMTPRHLHGPPARARMASTPTPQAPGKRRSALMASAPSAIARREQPLPAAEPKPEHVLQSCYEPDTRSCERGAAQLRPRRRSVFLKRPGLSIPTEGERVAPLRQRSGRPGHLCRHTLSSIDAAPDEAPGGVRVPEVTNLARLLWTP